MTTTPTSFNIVLAGVGGQGILFATKIISAAAMECGMSVIGSETHGMAQRGGSVVSHLKLGNAQSPLVRNGTAALLYALEPDEGRRNLPFLAPGGTVFVNTGEENWPGGALVEAAGEIEVAAIDADRIAFDMNNPRLANVILLGFSAAHPKSMFGPDDLRAALVSAAPEKFAGINLKAFDAGISAAAI